MTNTLTPVDRMNELWSDVTRFRYWRDVEAQVMRAQDTPDWWRIAGVPIDEEAVKEIAVIEEKTRHDVSAFVDWLEHKTGVSKIHYGLTSSDVVDTALSLQLRKALGHLRERLAKRGYPVHWINQATAEISIGTISGPVGTYSSVSPEIEERALSWLGLKPEPAPTQVVARDRHAAVLQYLSLTATVVDRMRGTKSDGTIVLHINALTALQNVALWHERDISHSSTERVIIPQSFIMMAEVIER